jgi:hypothetical protein
MLVMWKRAVISDAKVTTVGVYEQYPAPPFPLPSPSPPPSPHPHPPLSPTPTLPSPHPHPRRHILHCLSHKLIVRVCTVGTYPFYITFLFIIMNCAGRQRSYMYKITYRLCVCLTPAYWFAVRHIDTLIKKKRKFSSYKSRGLGCKVIYDLRPPRIWGKMCAFPYILGSPSSYMTLHPIQSEFPYL